MEAVRQPGPRSTGPVELRVHGVSGTPPESLLDRDEVFQVAGDSVAGIYVPTLDSERFDLRPRPDAPSVTTEVDLRGYTWGGLTSGSPGRAFWLLLTPFTLLNVAVRARPDFSTEDHPTLTAWFWRLNRLLGLNMTLLFVLTGVGVGHWLCQPGSSSCPPGELTIPLIGSSPRALFVLGALFPIVALAVVGFASWWSTSAYEKVTATVTEAPDTEHPAPAVASRAFEVPLDNPAMWQNAATVRRLRSLHLLAGVALSAVPLVDRTAAWAFGLALLALVYAVCAVCARLRDPRLVHYLAWVMALTAFGRGATVDGGVTTSLVETHSSGDFGWLAAAVVIAMLVTLAGLAVVNCRARRQAARATAARCEPMQHQQSAFGGMTTAVMASIGAFLAAIFSGGIYLYGSAFLRAGSLRPTLVEITTTPDGSEPAVIRLGSTAYTLGLGLFVVIVIAFAANRLLLGGGWYTRKALSRDYGDAATREDPARSKSVLRALFLGMVVDATPGLFTALVLGGVAALAWSAYLVWGDHSLFGQSPATLAGFGAFAAVYTLIGLVSLGALAFRVPTTRRSVGILWDVASFWPRTAHPLGAPCYAERTVPDLVTQITFLANGERRTVVVAAHSQGTVICTAAIRQVSSLVADPEETLGRVRFLTFGCVLRRLYGRYFPAYFGPAQLYAVFTALGGVATATDPRWVNLWRYTDYLGGQVTDGPPQVIPPGTGQGGTVDVQYGPQSWEWHTPDPPQFAHEPGLTTYSAPLRHSDFWRDASAYFQQAVVQLTLQEDGRRPPAEKTAARPVGSVPNSALHRG